VETISNSKINNVWRTAAVIGGVFLVGLGLFYLTMQPQAADLVLMCELTGATSLVSILAVYGAYRSGWINRSPHLGWTLAGGYLLAGLLVFLNVYITARIMFTSTHDLILATVLLVFATGIAVSVGFFLAGAVTSRIRQMHAAAHQVAAGDLGTRLAVSGRDEMAMLAQSFNEMVAQLQEAERQQHELDQLRRDLVAWAGHDLRTPLTSIRVIVEALADGLVTEETTRARYLRTAQGEIQSLSRLIDDLFEMAQVDAGGLRLEREPSSLADLISDTLESFSELAKRQSIRLDGAVAPGIGPVVMDSRRIGRVLANLVNNAIRYTPSGGSVSIQAQPVPGGVRVEVNDSGMGIAAQDAPYIFQRFYRGEKSRSRASGGTGLGLSIAQGIIEAHGGQIGFSSRADGGTSFYFNLPGGE
jgi:signal transduction histidine kinase